LKASLKRKLQTRILLALGALIVGHLVYGVFEEKFKTWESRIIDRLFVLRPQVNPAKQYHADAIVHIDANLYFSRPQHAQIVRNLAAMDVSAQLIDFIFTNQISKSDDQPLIDATRNAGNVYYGLKFGRLSKTESAPSPAEHQQNDEPNRWQILIEGAPRHLWHGDEPRLPYDALSRASKGLGFLNLTPDPDGIIRRLPLLVRYRGVIYPSLSLRVICDYLNVSAQQVVVTPGSSITLGGARPVGGAGTQDIIIPIDPSGSMILNIAQSRDGIPHYSYSEIFKASEDQAEWVRLKKQLSGKIAIVSETVETKYQIRTSGKRKLLSSGAIHALVLQNILTGSFLRELPSFAAVLIEIGLLVLVVFLSVRFSSPALSLGTMFLIGAYLGLAAVFFFYGGAIFQIVRPLLTILCALVFLLVGLGIENAILFAQTERARKMAERELEIGRQIQSGFFPTSLPAPKGWELATHFQAARHVAGDFYDVFTLGEDSKVGLVIADVCDKGVGAALFMALFRSFIRVLSGTAHSDGHLEVSNPATDPAEILKKTILSINNYISITHEQAGMFATIFYGILDPEKGTLTYINGGHEPPLIIGADGIKSTLDPSGPAVGLYPDLAFKTRTVILEPEDLLLIYTDGVVDARNKADEAFGKKRIAGLLEDTPLSAEELIKKIKIQLNEHIQSEKQFDDITIMALRRMG
jgi:serine phosphatase RsbU (regulator of sigma subunit)/CHASE2 domain-containing sensor protein